MRTKFKKGLRLKMHFLFLLITISLIPGKITGQTIDNKLNINFGIGPGFTMGENISASDGISIQSLFSNYQKLYSYIFQADYKIDPNWGGSFKYHNGNFSRWKFGNSSFYDHPKSTVSAISINLNYWSPFKNTGLLNAFSFFAGVGPSINKVNVWLANSAIFSESLDNYVRETRMTSVTGPGINAHFNAAFNINQFTGFFIQYNFSYIWTKSVIFHDKQIIYNDLNFGIRLRLMPDKRYFTR